MNPQEPWPYNDIILDDIPDLPPIYDDGLGVEGEGGAGTSEKIFETPDIDMLAIEDAKPVAEKKRHSPEKVATARLMGTAGSLKRKKSSISGSGGSLAGRVKARQEREGAASAGSKGSSDRSRATTPASKEPTSPGVPGSQIGSGSNSSSPSRRHAAAARAQYDEPTTPRPTSPMQGPGKFRMLRCL